METVVTAILTALGTLAITLYPLYQKFAELKQKIKAQDSEVAMAEQKRQHEAAEAKAERDRLDKQAQAELDRNRRIDIEAEFKRILEIRDQELQRFRDHDVEQDKQVTKLFESYVQSQKTEARQAEQIRQLKVTVNQLQDYLQGVMPSHSPQKLPPVPFVKLDVSSPDSTETQGDSPSPSTKSEGTDSAKPSPPQLS